MSQVSLGQFIDNISLLARPQSRTISVKPMVPQGHHGHTNGHNVSDRILCALGAKLLWCLSVCTPLAFLYMAIVYIIHNDSLYTLSWKRTIPSPEVIWRIYLLTNAKIRGICTLNRYSINPATLVCCHMLLWKNTEWY